MNFIVPAGYTPDIDLKETQIAIKVVKDFFQKELTKQLNLTRVSAPLFVTPESGLNDNLNGVERPVAFDIKEGGRKAEIVHSLAKWKRYALKQYGFQPGEGLYTDMNAIRRDEHTDNIHSIYVDQWDWEKVITKEERTRETLEETVRAVYKALKITEDYMAYEYDYIGRVLPEHIEFITSQELEDRYPDLTPKQREYEIVKLHGAVFIEHLALPLCKAVDKAPVLQCPQKDFLGQILCPGLVPAEIETEVFQPVPEGLVQQLPHGASSFHCVVLPVRRRRPGKCWIDSEKINPQSRWRSPALLLGEPLAWR